MSRVLKPITILRRTKLALKIRGWHQHGFYNPHKSPETGEVCLHGAVRVACRGTPLQGIAHATGAAMRSELDALKALKAAAGTNNLVYFNDKGDQTEANIHATLDAAIASLR